MSNQLPIRLKRTLGTAFFCGLGMCMALFGSTQMFPQAPQPESSAVVLDRVVAVVNSQAILSSDLDEEIQLSVLDRIRVGQGVLTRELALQQLIARVLIQQQIRQEDAQAVAPTQAEMDARIVEIRKEMPACVRQNCATETGWKAFLSAHSLTPERVQVYLRRRVEILRFIEQRFRQGIRITPQEIETYYHETLVPQYGAGEAIPAMDAVAPRIEEILLQKQVNVLFDDWLKNLRKQGDIEVLDPSLEAPEQGAGVASDTPEKHPSGAEEAAEKLGICGLIGGKCPSAAKANVDSAGVMRGLKPPPPSVSSFSAGSEIEYGTGRASA
jgi:peptidyl-prolyl cis-trans isomerase SurA